MAAYDTSLTSSSTYDGSTIPADSVLYYDDGQDNTAATQGTHDGGNAEAALADSNQSWTNDEWIGYTVHNITASESGSVTDNDGTTVTATLSGSETWDDDDTYILEHATKLTDTTKTWTVNEWANFKVRNVTDGSVGTISSNTANTLTVSSLSGGSNNAFRIGDFYEIISDIDTNDVIYYAPDATGTTSKVIRLQVYDTSAGSYSDVVTVTIEIDGDVSLVEGGSVSISVTGVPSITTSVVSTTATKGGYVPPIYIRKKKDRQESILEAVQALVEEIESSDVVVPEKLEDRAKKVVERAEAIQTIQDSSEHRAEMQRTLAQLKRLENTVNKYIADAREDEEQAIRVLLELI